MILDTIAASTLERVAAAKEALPLAEQIARARDLDSNTGFPFEQALAKQGMSFICEVKKASPSKGLIAAEFPYVQIAREYEAAGADAISVLTEPAYFQGKNEYLTEIRQAVKIPLLRKDFTVDEYMIYEAKNIGANAVLLICAILSPMQLSEYAGIAGELGLSALVEAHDEKEVEMALKAGARIVGVNNRNLKDFTVDINNSVRLREMVPENILFVFIQQLVQLRIEFRILLIMLIALFQMDQFIHQCLGDILSSVDSVTSFAHMFILSSFFLIFNSSFILYFQSVLFRYCSTSSMIRRIFSGSFFRLLSMPELISNA